jgi:hypothetical protein
MWKLRLSTHILHLHQKPGTRANDIDWKALYIVHQTRFFYKKLTMVQDIRLPALVQCDYVTITSLS